ncbi:FAD-dependent oxidoreductase [Candidatus Sumerlaeota bacterium]|nr:FAD-dependent oxidoreductase [Candidatus Sumerlaeota bacterium]
MKKKLVVIGAVAGGASAAARARRLSEDSQIVLVERGDYVSFANCGLPYHIAGEIQERSKLILRTPESLARQLAIDVRVRTEAVSIDTRAKTVTLRRVDTGEESVESYDALILSPGAAPIRPPIPGADLPQVLSLRTIPDMDAINRRIDEAGARRVVAIGGGFIGLEMAEGLRRRGLEVALVERLPQVLLPLDVEMAAYLHEELRDDGVDLYLADGVAAIEETSDGGIEAVLESGRRVSGDFALLAVGVRPEVDLAREAGIRIGSLGGIEVDEQMRTSAPEVYAVGDAVEVRDFVTGETALVPLAGPANRQGRVAANAVFGRADAYKATQGTLIVRVFSLVAAATGANEKCLRRRGIRYEKIYHHHGSHVGYYPGAGRLALKILFSPEDERLLGAQIVGTDGVDKRIDVLSTAIRLGASVRQLTELELAYAPPYGAAKDPVNFAGFIASNILDGDVEQAHWDDFPDGFPSASGFLLDVRDPNEVEREPADGAHVIPLPELRSRIAEIPRDRDIVAICDSGTRSYYACRILKQSGFRRVRNLSGGYRTWSISRSCARPEGRS